MDISANYFSLQRIFGDELGEILDCHLMESLEIDRPHLNEIKTFEPKRYEEMVKEALGDW